MTDIQLWLSAIEIGFFYGLVALAYLLILEGAGFFNFAIGPYAMVAGLGASWLVIEKDLGVGMSIGLAIVFVVVLSIVTELVVIRPIEKRSAGGELPALVAVAAVLFTIEQAAGFIFGRRELPGQMLWRFDPIEIAGGFLQPSALMLIVATPVLFALVWLWLRFGGIGRMLRAVGDNSEAASLLGLPVSRIRLTAFVVGGALAAIAGLLFAPKAGVGFQSGLAWTISGFLALVIGGTGATIAPLFGGLLLGIVQVFVPYYLGSAAPHYVILAIALVFFAFRPEGLFTRKVRA